MKVDNNNGTPQNLGQMAKWERRQSQQAQKRMDQIKKAEKNQLEQMRKDSEGKVDRAEKQNEKRLKETENKYRKRIDNIADIMTKTQEKLKNEEALLNQQFEEKKGDAENKFEEEYIKNQDHFQTTLNEYEVKSDDAISKTIADQQERMSDLVTKGKGNEEFYQNVHKENLAKEKLTFDSVKLARETEHKNRLRDLAFEQEKELTKMKTDFERKKTTLQVEQDKQFKTLKKRFEQQVKQSDEDFKTRYKEILDKNKNSLNVIDELSQKSIKNIKERNQNIYDNIASHQEDPFYHIGLLEPQVKDFDKYYEISVMVPSYDKDKIQLNGHDREMKLTFNRNFTDNIIKEDGSDNRYGRIESYTKIFNLPEPINSKTINERYQEGMLTFIVQKL